MLSTKYLALLAVVAVISVGTAYAANEYNTTLLGNVEITGNLLVDGTLTGPTITELDKRIAVLEFSSSPVVTSDSTKTTDTTD